MQPKGHFVGIDPSRDLRIAEQLQLLLIEITYKVQRVTLQFSINAVWICEVENSIPWLRSRTPVNVVGRKPLDQLAVPPLMPLPVLMTINAGRSRVSAPRP